MQSSAGSSSSAPAAAGELPGETGSLSGRRLLARRCSCKCSIAASTALVYNHAPEPAAAAAAAEEAEAEVEEMEAEEPDRPDCGWVGGGAHCLSASERDVRHA